MPHPAGADPSAIRQLLLQHTFLPLVSIHASHGADTLFQRECHNPLISALQVLRPYGNNAKYGVANQGYKITNSLLITRTYGSFPVRFEPPLPELLTVHNPADDKLRGLFSILALERLMRETAKTETLVSLLYTAMFRKVITSNRVVLFDTLNHPVAQVFVVAHGADTADSLRAMIVEFRNFNFPRYFQTADLLVHVFVMYDSQTTVESELAVFLDEIRGLSVGVTPIAMCVPLEATVRMSVLENATVDEDVQRMSLRQSEEYVAVPKSLDSMLRARLHEFISRVLVPHMERHIRVWDDLVLAPKKSISGRFFSVSRKIFNSADGDHQPGAYNHSANYYPRSSPEQAIRKLADWSLMLKDFKYAYSTYDLIKKDYTNDKAWAYVAAAQEMCVVSLLLAQTQPLASDVMPQAPNKNTLRKIRHDIIEPYIDNLTYTFKSRLNVKTYAIKTYLVVAELLLNMSAMFNLLAWWADLIERYYLTCMAEVDGHMENSSEAAQVTRAILYERLGYSTGRSMFVPDGYTEEVEAFLARKMEEGKERENNREKTGGNGDIEEGNNRDKREKDTVDGGGDKVAAREGGESDGVPGYVNQNKLAVPKDNSIKGLTRFRKSSLWYILSMREWVLLDNKLQVKRLVRNIAPQYNLTHSTSNWYDRKDLILAGIKAANVDSTKVQ